MKNYDCPVCHGTGKIHVSSIDGDYITTCNDCKGTGKQLITITLKEYEELKLLVNELLEENEMLKRQLMFSIKGGRYDV